MNGGPPKKRSKSWSPVPVLMALFGKGCWHLDEIEDLEVNLAGWALHPRTSVCRTPRGGAWNPEGTGKPAATSVHPGLLALELQEKQSGSCKPELCLFLGSGPLLGGSKRQGGKCQVCGRAMRRQSHPSLQVSTPGTLTLTV